MTTTRYLALDAKTQWNMAVLHLIGHPIPVAAWYKLQTLYDAGYSPEEVAVDHTADCDLIVYHDGVHTCDCQEPLVYSHTTFDPFDGFEYPK